MIEDYMILAGGTFCVVVWVWVEFKDSIIAWWNKEIVSDYPYQDDL